jgi:hypothetical protein
MSVNWSKYCKPWDVIFGYPNGGIALFIVFEIKRDFPSELPATMAQQKPKPRTFRPSHEPFDDNYSHSEIAVFRDGVRVTKTSQISDEAKKEFRQIVSDRSRIIKSPV